MEDAFNGWGDWDLGQLGTYKECWTQQHPLCGVKLTVCHGVASSGADSRRSPPYISALFTSTQGIALASNPDYKVLGATYPW